MVEKGHFEELEHLMEMINANEEKRKLRQTFVFSATMTLIHELPKHLKHKKKTKNLTTEEKLEQVMFLRRRWFLILSIFMTRIFRGFSFSLKFIFPYYILKLGYVNDWDKTEA